MLRNLLLIGFIVGCMLLILYSSYYGTMLTKLYTEGFSTVSYPVHVHFAIGKVSSDDNFAELKDDPTEMTQIISGLYNYVGDSANTEVNGKIEIKDTNTTSLRDDKKSELLTFQTSGSYDHDLQQYKEYVNLTTDPNVYNIFIFPVLSAGNVYFSFPNENRNDRNYYVATHTYNEFSKQFTNMNNLPALLEHTLKEIAKTEGVVVPEPETPTTPTTPTTPETPTTPTNGGGSIGNIQIPSQITINVTGIPDTVNHNLTGIPDTVNHNLTGVPDAMNHNVTHSGGQSLSYLEDYDSVNLSQNPMYKNTPQITTSNPNAVTSIGMKFFTGVLGGLFSSS